MPNQDRAPRGSYAKGVAKREEILSRALDVIAEDGVQGASVKRLAAAVGLSQAGLLHYFGSKEELFTSILRKRDEQDLAGFDLEDLRAVDVERARDGYAQIIRHNAQVPGLVALFSQLAVDAASPEHPAHAFFVERNALLRETFAATLAEAQREGRVRSDVDARTLARILQAVADGMQLQWMHEPDVDMAAVVDAAFSLMLRGGDGGEAQA